MDNTQDALSSLLSNPEALSKAMEIAKSFMGNIPQQPAQETQAETPQQAAAQIVKNQTQLPVQDNDAKLLLALKPFLSEKRSEKVGTVLSLMKTMQLLGATDIFDWRGH